MRWIAVAEKEPRLGDTRVVSKFALFPIVVLGITFWLEYVDVIQTYSNPTQHYTYPYTGGWQDTKLLL